MSTDFSRRDFLTALAAAAGVMLVGDSVFAAVRATKREDGTYRVPGGGVLAAGTALSFTTLPDNKAGILVKTQAGELYALSAACTHRGCTVAYKKKDGKEELHCPCHGSSFDLEGKATHGPAFKPLPRLKVKVSGDDALVTMG